MACATGAGLPIAMPTPLPEMWLSALSRRNAPIPRGGPRSLWPGCVPESRTQRGLRPVQRPVSWIGRVWSRDANAAAGTGLGSLSPLAVWWVKLGIVPERIEPGRPEQNGRLERLHRTLKAETASPPMANRKRQRWAFDRLRQSYNFERPHEALGQRPPALLYSPSFRPYPYRVSHPEYGTGVTVRRVRGNGAIKWKGNLIYVSEALKGEPIGLVQQDEHVWTIQFGSLLIGALDDTARRVDRTPVKVLPMSPV